MPKFLVTAYYTQTWEMLVEAENEEEMEDITSADIFDNGFKVDECLNDMEIQQVADDFTLFGDVPVAESEIDE